MIRLTPKVVIEIKTSQMRTLWFIQNRPYRYL